MPNFIPPICPECKKPLERVEENVYEHYNFNHTHNAYNEAEWSATVDILCAECGADVSELFEEGVCNYGL